MFKLSEIITVAIVVVAIILLIVRAIKRLKNPFSCCQLDKTNTEHNKDTSNVSPCAGCASYSKCKSSNRQ